MKTLEQIRNSEEYTSAMDLLFISAMQYVMQAGTEDLKERENVDEVLEEIDKRHDDMEAEGKVYFINRDFEKVIVECAHEIAQHSPIEIIQYIQENHLLAD